jgi:hypothetical protein
MVLRIPVLAVVLLMSSTAALSQVSTWWTASAESSRETGRIQELRDKRRVFVQVSYRSTELTFNTQPELASLRGAVSRALSAYDGLEVVLAPERADLAITVTASHVPSSGNAGGNFAASLDPEVEAGLEVLVLVRGAMQRDGGYRPRVVWELSSQNVRGEPAPAAAFALDGFINQLKRVRGEDKK